MNVKFDDLKKDIGAIIENEDNFVDDERVPYAQWLSPHSDAFGLAIRQDQAQLAGFEPDARWELKKAKFKNPNVVPTKGKKVRLEDIYTHEELYVSDHPRMIIVNAVSSVGGSYTAGVGMPFNANPLFIINDEGITTTFNRSLFDQGGWKAFNYLIFFLVSEDNKLLCKRPFRLKLAKKSSRSIRDEIKLWGVDLLNFYAANGIKLNLQMAVGKTPSCSFYFYHVFEPELIATELIGTSGESSAACICSGYKPVTVENFGNVFIAPGSSTSLAVNDFFKSGLNLYLTPFNFVEQEKRHIAVLEQGGDGVYALNAADDVDITDNESVPF